MLNYRDITLSLAGVFQATQQVINLATKGVADPLTMESLIASLLKIDASSCLDVYGSVAKVKPGLRLIDTQLSVGASGRSTELGGYIANLLNLERQLNRSQEMQSVIATRIVQIKRLTASASLMDDTIIHAIANLYKDTISTLPLRIQVVGDQSLLKQPDIQDQVRCLLFCGLRSAVLWRQMGGKRRQLIFNRRQLLNTADDLLLGR